MGQDGRERTELFGGMAFGEALTLSDLEAADAGDALRSLTACLEREGCIGDGFLDALVERESNFPTGLATKTTSVAIPHADPAFVKVPALAVARLRRPVSFRAMDNPEHSLAVQLVFLLALKDPEVHVAFLKKFALAIQSGDFLSRLMGCEGRACLCEEVVRVLGKPATEKVPPE